MAAYGVFAGNVPFLPGDFFLESSQDNITATAGGGQANAFQINTQTVRVTTVATAGDSVKLPASAPGLEVLVINHGGKPMQVYGLGNDTVDDVAAGTGVSQMQNSFVIYSCASTGKWYTEGLATGFVPGTSLQTFSAVDGLAANAGGVQAGATPITNMINRFTTVGGIGFSSLLPVAAAGLNITVINAGANSMNVFPAVGDAINALGANVAFALAAGKTAEFFSTVTGQWHSILSA